MEKLDKILEISKNKKAYFDYEIISSLECGIELISFEIKQIANKKCDISGSFAKIINGEVLLFDMNIQRYEQAVFYDKIQEKRTRKLLLHKREIKTLSKEISLNKHYTLIPTKIYIKNGKCKIELSLCKGKKLYNKKQAIKERDLDRYKGN